MSKSRQPIDWYRMAIEGFVIVASILLAFAIDAWWDQLQEVRDANDQVARVGSELRANVALLKTQDHLLEDTTQAAREFLSMMGPDVDSVSTQDVGLMFARIYGVGTLSLSKSASQDFLSSGQLTANRWVDIRLSLAELLSEVRQAESSSLELRQMRPRMLEQLHGSVSGLDVVRMHPVMVDYPASRFASSVSTLLSDMAFESLIANYAIRMELNRVNARRLLEKHLVAIDLIESGN